MEDIEFFVLSDRSRDMVKAAVDEGRCFNLAKIMGLDYQEKVIENFKKEPLKNIYEMAQLIGEQYRIEEILVLIKDKIDIESIATGPADEIGLDDEYEIHRAVNFVLQELRGLVNVGAEFIRVGLNSPVVNNRNMALSVLEAWMKQEKSSLETINPEIYDCLRKTVAIECRDDVRKSMQDVLSNSIELEEY